MKRQSYCYSCKSYRKHLKRLYPEWVEEDKQILNASVLDDTGLGFIFYSGKDRKWTGEITLEKARRLAQEGAAKVVSPILIVRLFDSKSFKNYLLERDRGECQYCDRPGKTIDHIVPKCKGGLKTPANCVLACDRCNCLKADLDVDDFIYLARSRNIKVHYPFERDSFNYQQQNVWELIKN